MDAKTIIDVTSPVNKSLVDELVTPIIKKLKKDYKKIYNDYLVPKGTHFKNYLDEAYKEYSTVNTLVVLDRIKSLKEIYVPLTLIKEDRITKEKESVVVKGIPVDLVKRCRKLLIIDTAGMGKSTMLKRMFLDVNDVGLKEVGIPLFVDLRRLKKDWSIIDELERRLSSLSEKFDKELLLYLLQIGGFIFFLDGYDEISLNDKDSVTQSLQDFIKKANNNYFILTSRPEPAIWGFEGFEIYNIKQLKKQEAFSLLRKYDTHDNKEISTKLIKLLKSNDYKSAVEFLETPLLTTLLFNAFEYKEIIPLKQHLFYRQVYDAYFEYHDLKKGGSYIHEKLSGLDTDDFCRMLRFVGFHSLKNGIEYSKDEILGLIGQAKNFFGYMTFSNASFLRDIITAVPLFCEEGSKYKWVHKSLMEYFAAMFISQDIKNTQDKRVLSLICKSVNVDKYINMLDLYCDIAPEGFSKNIVYNICKEYVQFYESINYKNNKVSKELIDIRIGSLFEHEHFIVKNAKNRIGKKIITTFSSNDNEKRNIIINDFLKDNNILKEYSEGRDNCMVVQTIDTEVVVFFFMRTPLTKLLPLLFKRSKRLFKKRTIHSRDDELEEKIIYKVDVVTGDKTVKSYAHINNLIYQHVRDSYNSSYLDYSACKKEIDVIEKRWFSNDGTSDLIEGL